MCLVQLTRNSVRTFTRKKITRKRTYGFWITYVNSGLPDEECKEFRRLDRWSESKAAASGFWFLVYVRKFWLTGGGLLRSGPREWRYGWVVRPPHQVISVSWSFMNFMNHEVHESSWEFMRVHESSREFMRVHEGSWEFLRVLESSWEFMKVHESS